MSHNENLKLAQRGAYLSLIVYIILSIVKYVTGFVFNSAAVRADALKQYDRYYRFFSCYYWIENFN